MMSDPDFGSPASPRPSHDAQGSPTVLSIGVTGHRSARIDSAKLTGLIAQTLAKIEQAATSLVSPIELRIVCALADGADSLVAEAAIARGWTLSSVLPFDRERYRADFTAPDDLARFERLLAASSGLFEIAGNTDCEAAPAAYERAGRIVLGQADILFAVWDGHPAQGRGGTAQIIAEAVARDIPVIQLDPDGQLAPILLWDGLTEHDLGQQDIETVPRGGLDGLPRLLGQVLMPPDDPSSLQMLAQLESARPRWTPMAIAYPLLLAVTGVQRLSLRHIRPPDMVHASSLLHACFAPAGRRASQFAARLETALLPHFARADMIASQAAQLFRSGYVANFTLSALAVILTLVSLALPISAKPLMVTLELITIATVLIVTRTGNRRAWHRRWLDNRNLAEGLRCLAVAAQIGLGPELARNAPGGSPDWVRHDLRQTSRAIGLPDVVVDAAYLAEVRMGLTRLIETQIGYLSRETARMHRLEHRLHVLGTGLFATTALACIAAMAIEAGLAMTRHELSEGASHVFLVGMTMVTAGLPALGSAIYGIRMQGEFASVAERAHGTLERLRVLQHTLAEDPLSFDTLQRRIAHLTALLTNDTADWHRTHHARPLALPG